ncbi:lipopolysaccharide biosynthesis protein [Geodermatophilus sp. SYSU D00691]
MPPEVPSVRGLRTGALTGLFGQATIIGCGVLIQMLLARLLAPSAFGAYTLLATVVYIAAATVRLGLSQVAVRAPAAAFARGGRAAADQVARRVVFSSSIAVAGALPVLALLVVPLGLGQLFPGRDLDGLILVITGLIAAEAVRLVISEGFRGLHKQGQATLLGTALRTVLLLLPLAVLSLSTTRLELEHVVWLMLGASLATLATAWIRFVLVVRGRASDAHTIRGYYRAGIPFLVTELTAAGLSMGDVVVIGQSGDHEALALYAAASRVAALVAVPAFVATAVLMPVIASLWSTGDRARLQILLRGYGLVAALPACLMLAGIVLAGDHLLSLLFGPFYEAGWPFMLVLTVGAVVNTALGFSSTVLMMTGHARTVARVAVAFSLVTVLTEVVVSRFGSPLGVAAVAAAGLIAQQSFLTTLCWRRTGLLALPGTVRHARLALRGQS